MADLEQHEDQDKLQYDANAKSDSDSDEEHEEGNDNLYFVHDVVEQGGIDRLRELLPLKTDQSAEESSSSMRVMAVETCLLEKDDMGCLPVHVAIIYQRMDSALHLLRYSEALTTAMVRMKCADLNTPFVHLILRVGGINPQFTTDLITEIYGSESRSSTPHSDDLRAVLFEALNAKDDEGNSVFHLCAMFNLDQALCTLLRFFNKIIKDDADTTMTSIARIPEVKSLLEKGNRLGLRPLHTALKFDSMDVARQLVDDLGADVNSLTSLKQTPLHVAAAHGIAAGVALLLRGDTAADTSRVDLSGCTALDIAKNSHFEDVSRLLSSGVEVAVGNDPPRTRFFFHQDSLRHLPMAYHRRGGIEPPPENPERIDTLVDPLVGILRSREFKKAHISWDHEIDKADIADILRVHEYNYVRKIRQSCESLRRVDATQVHQGDEDEDDEDTEESNQTFVLDADTALSLRSYEAASRAAGAVCRAVDQVVSGECTNAFCIVRPPGHHAGPTGKVTCCNDPDGSHGFCVFNNVAIGAAYARSHYKRQGINRIAILDFDVHHGNGTEEIIRQLVPSTTELRYSTPYGEGKQIIHQYKPWRNEDDANNVFFCSVHGYGHKDPQGEFSSDVQDAWFYPGSGESVETQTPLIMNVGMGFCQEGSSVSRLKWRSSFRDGVLPKLKAFNPDLIFMSSGFDAHKKEHVNWGYVALLEQDYEWLVQHVKQVANSCCQGRLISVLEGGYNFHGRMVSPFARSVAAHARALACPSREEWREEIIEKEAEHERSILENYLHPVSATTTANVKTKKRASAVETANVNHEREAEEKQEEASTVTQSRSKRARKQVDYVALAAELAEQDKKGRA